MADTFNQLPAPQDFDDPIQFLRASHVIVTHELDVLSDLLEDVERTGLTESFKNKSEWREVSHFFTVTIVQHEQDEEQGLFPLMRDRVPNVGFQLPSAPIHFLTEGHKLLQHRVEALVSIWKKFENGEVVEASQFTSAGRELISLYREHIATEEIAVYQPANDVLTPNERNDIMQIMRRNHHKSQNMSSLPYGDSTVSGNFVPVIVRARSRGKEED